ncbi:MAG: glycosyltransferase family 2 protein [Candidatus Omnitrophica bacterium]|nr:glycosyltransferase family 2 protein [Candidatus Omnitrophota bacterium]
MLSVVIPFYNEEANVERVISGIEQAFKRRALEIYEIMAVDNGSRDKTGEILTRLRAQNSRVHVVCVPVNQGMGWGIQQGLKLAAGQVLCIQCGDGQTEPDEIVNCYEMLQSGGFDLCKVDRIVRGDGPLRAFISWVFNRLSDLMFGTKTHDVNGLPKLFTRSLYEALYLESKGWFLDAEVMIKAVRKGCKIGEVKTKFYKREGGSSNVNWKTIVEFIWNMIRVRIVGFAVVIPAPASAGPPGRKSRDPG